MTIESEITFDINTSCIDLEGKIIHTHRLEDGRFVWPAAEVSEALGYANNSIVSQIGREWSEEFFEGKDYVRSRMEVFQGIHEKPQDNVGRPSIFLTESGFNLVCLLTKKPIGKKLRRFVADEVMPMLRESVPNHDRRVRYKNGHLIHQLEEEVNIAYATSMNKLLPKFDDHIYNQTCHHFISVQDYMDMVWGPKDRNNRSWGKKIADWAGNNRIPHQTIRLSPKGRLLAYRRKDLDRFFRENHPRYMGE